MNTQTELLDEVVKYEYRWQCPICRNKRRKATYVRSSLDAIHVEMKKHINATEIHIFDYYIQRRPAGTKHWMHLTSYGWR